MCVMHRSSFFFKSGNLRSVWKADASSGGPSSCRKRNPCSAKTLISHIWVPAWVIYGFSSQRISYTSISGVSLKILLPVSLCYMPGIVLGPGNMIMRNKIEMVFALIEFII